MNPSDIIVIINKKDYRLSISDVESIRQLPDADRRQLVELLEVIKRDMQPAVDSIQSAPTSSVLSDSLSQQYTGDDPANADAIIAQLIMEEDAKQKPKVTKHVIHRWMAAAAIIILLLVLIL